MEVTEYGPEGLKGEIEGLVVLYGAAKVYAALKAAAEAFGEGQELKDATQK